MNKKSSPKKYQTKNTVAVVIGGLLFWCWVWFRIFFPTFNFIYNQNTESDFSWRMLNNKKYLQIKLKGRYPFAKIKLNLQANGSQQQRHILKKVYQDEMGLYQQSKNITSLEEMTGLLRISEQANIFNGQLISKNDSVYFITDGQYRAFADAETFDALGFNWQKVKKFTGSEFAGLNKGEDIVRNTTAYLSASFVQINERIYFLTDGSKREVVDNKAKQFIRKNFSIISVSLDRLKAVGKMICTPINKNKKIKCKFQKNEEIILPRAKILIEMDEKLEINKAKAKVDTFDRFSRVVPKITLHNIKQILNYRYESIVIKVKNILK